MDKINEEKIEVITQEQVRKMFEEEVVSGFHETSALLGDNVKSTFDDAIWQAIQSNKKSAGKLQA